MPATDLPTLAERLARHAHRDQVDKAGQPYVGHLERVVGHLLRLFPDATEDEIAAAWLHDVVEDTGLDGHYLLDAGIDAGTVRVVYELTRPRGDYLGYIDALAAWGSLSAVRVKLADNYDNSDPNRPPVPEGERMVAKRYAPARAMLEARLRREGWDNA